MSEPKDALKLCREWQEYWAAHNEERLTRFAKSVGDEIERLRESLAAVMRQAETDLASAHAEICKLQGLDPAAHSWPEWSPQANSLRWFAELRNSFNLTK